MPNNSIEQDILDDLITVIRAISTPIDLLDEWVTDEVTHFESIVSDYYVVVVPVSSEPIDHVGNSTKNQFRWMISIFVSPGSDSAPDRMTLAAAIRSAIMADVRRSGLCSLTQIENTEYDMAEDEAGQVAHIATIEGFCNAHHKVTDYENA